MNIIAKFEYNNKTYVFYIKDDSLKILYGFLNDNNEVIPIVDFEEIKKMNKISKHLFISSNPNNHIKLGKTRYNGKLFQIMYDKISNLKFFYEVKEKQCFFPSESDAQFLMTNFNLSPIYFLKEKTKNRDPKYNGKNVLRKIVHISKISILVVYTSFFLFSSANLLSNINYDELDGLIYHQTTTGGMFLYEREDSDIEEEYEVAESLTDFSIDLVYDAIDKNINLNLDEKEFMKSYSDILIKNQEYINTDFLLNTLSDLDTTYIDGFCDWDTSVQGYYVEPEHSMVIYRSNSFALARKPVIRHEGFHALTGPNAYVNLGPALGEAVTEVLSSEYYENSVGAYPKFCTYLKILMEIVGSEPFTATYFSGDINYLIDSFKKIIPDENMAYNLISDLDTYMVYTNMYSTSTSASELDLNMSKDRIKELNDNRKSIFLAIANYFYAKNGYPITLDAIEMAYYRQIYNNGPMMLPSYALGEEINTIYISVDSKGYFRDYSIRKYPNSKIIIHDMDEEAEKITRKEVIVDESNRKLLSLPVGEGEYILKEKSPSK